MRVSKAQAMELAGSVRGKFRPGAWDTQFPPVEDWGVSQSVAGFFKANDGKQVDTVQVTFRLGELVASWQPGERVADARATFATLDGSRVDYDGTVAHGTDNTLVRVQNVDDGTALVTFYRRVG